MAFTEIAVALITAGPAYIAVWLTARNPQPTPTQPQACAQAETCERCEDRTSDDAMTGVPSEWAFAA